MDCVMNIPMVHDVFAIKFVKKSTRKTLHPSTDRSILHPIYAYSG